MRLGAFPSAFTVEAPCITPFVEVNGVLDTFRRAGTPTFVLAGPLDLFWAREPQGCRVDQRATIATADMRKLPFEPAAFDAVVSAYAIDHLNRQGTDQSLAEAARVLKPGGELLLMIIANEKWRMVKKLMRRDGNSI